MSLRPLRPHQQRALDDLRLSLARGHRRPMLQAPTGFGKTLAAAHIIQRALDKGKRVAFTVPALSLIDQTVAAFWSCPSWMDGLGLRRVWLGHHVSFRIRWAKDSQGPNGDGTDCRSLR